MRDGIRLQWTPWDNCSYPAILDYPDTHFPNGIWTIALASLILFTSCIILARICDYYFLPAVKIIAYRWGLKGDVVSAVVFASAASWPELALSVITVFNTAQAGVGIGTIVGTSVFNTLAVPALCSFAFTKGTLADPVAITRDTAMSGIAVLLLGLVIKDQGVGLMESATMLIFYVVYVIVLSSFPNLIRKRPEIVYEKCSLLRDSDKFYVQINGISAENPSTAVKTVYGSEADLDFKVKPRCWAGVINLLKNVSAVFVWPIHNVLRLAIPPPERCTYLVVLLGMIYISMVTYVIAWMITALGYKLNIPNSLLSLTVLAVGLGYPDLISSLKVAKDGTASEALSNALGANTFNLLVCLGLPWFIKGLTSPDLQGGQVLLNLDGVLYSVNIMFSALLMFYLALVFNRFMFNAKVGCICIAIYIFFVVTMSLLEYNVFFFINKPLCDIKDYYNSR